MASYVLPSVSSRAVEWFSGTLEFSMVLAQGAPYHYYRESYLQGNALPHCGTLIKELVLRNV